MIEVLVWLLVIGTMDGGLDTRLTFKSEDQCMHVLNHYKDAGIRYARGKCIEANIYIKKS